MLSVTSRRLGFTQAKAFRYSALVGIAGFFDTTNWSAVSIAFGVVAIALYAGAFWIGNRTSKICADHDVGVEQQYLVGEDGVTIREVDSEARYGWSHFDAAFESPTVFALRHGIASVILPLRAFSSNDVSRVRALISTHLTIAPMK